MSSDTRAAHSPRQAVDRRTFMKTVGAGAGAVAVGAGGEFSPGPSAVGEADALAPVAIGIAVGGATAFRWLIEQTGGLGAEDPADGLTAAVLRQQVYDTARTRQSTNASTFVDNGNIVSAGLENSLYSEGKLAAIQAIDNGDTESDVNTAAQDAIADHISTVKENLLKSWNESVAELDNMMTSLADHADTSVGNVLDTLRQDGTQAPLSVNLDSSTVTLPDGSSMSVHRVVHENNSSDSWDPAGTSNSSLEGRVRVQHDGNSIQYLSQVDWSGVWSSLNTAQSNAENGLSTWVTNVYDSVQTGDIAIEDLMTSTDLANLAPEEEGFNRATTDLLALNIPVDLEREAEISLSSMDATLYGYLAVTGETTVQAGDTIDPSTHAEDFYLTYDVSEGHGGWTDYEESVDGGTVTFTSEPHPETLYTINTTAGETAEVTAGDFTEESGSWTVDVSGQLENPITNIDSVDIYSESDETNMVTVKLEEQFTVVGFTNEETGESEDSASYEPPTQPEDDTNYITQEEWDQREQQIQELIDEYEENTGGGGGGSILPDLGTGGMLGGVVTLVVGVYLAGQALGN